jgi:hypothetical protein
LSVITSSLNIVRVTKLGEKRPADVRRIREMVWCENLKEEENCKAKTKRE